MRTRDTKLAHFLRDYKIKMETMKKQYMGKIKKKLE